jgi:hypothetical protein
MNSSDVSNAGLLDTQHLLQAWFNSLPSNERPTGVVAGRVHGGTRPKISGVPPQATGDEL